MKYPHDPSDPRFRRELDVLRLLEAPLAPSLIGAGHTASGHPYAVVELIGGGTLAHRLAQRRTPFPAHEAVAIVERLATAVDALHAAGVVHRDLKPENIFDRGWGATLIDFGLARRGVLAEPTPEADEELTRTGARLGTVLYMAPEQCRSPSAAGAPADRYALAAIAYELLTGRPPFGGDAGHVEHSHLTATPPSMAAPALDDVFARALAKSPGARFPSATAFANALAAATRSTRRETPASERSTQAPLQDRRFVALQRIVAAGAPSDLRAALEGCGAHILRSSGGPLLIAFADDSAAGGVRKAMALARELGQSAVETDIHVTELSIRARRRGVLLAGDAIDRPDAWAFARGQRGERVLLTPEAARHAPLGTVVAVGHLGGFRPVPGAQSIVESGDGAIPLKGRDEHLARLTAAACSSLAAGGGQPGVAAALGARGLGKSRILRELDRALTNQDCEVISLSAQLPSEQASPLRIELLGRALGLQRAPSESDVRAACAAVLADADVERAVAALAGDAALESPAADRHLIAQTLALLLRRRARTRPLAVLIDDAHLADFSVLDALELASLAEHGASIWVCAAADPLLVRLRPTWGARAARADLVELVPLDVDASRALLADLLHPVDYVPHEAAMDLVQLTHGNPLEMVQLAHGLRASGALRRRPGTDSWFLAVDEVAQLAVTPLSAQLARRMVDALPGELAQVLELCAVAARPVTPDEIDRVQRVLGQRAVDAGAALASIARGGALSAGQDGTFALRRPMLAAAVEDGMDRARRVAAHAAWLDVASQAERPDPARMARHAAACGQRDRAAVAFVELGDQALDVFRYVAADGWYSQALESLRDEWPEIALRALRGRAKVRYATERHAESLADLERAAELAAALGDARTSVEISLEEATALDWLSCYPESADAADRARMYLRDLDDPRLEARSLMARGRTLLRTEQWTDGVSACEAAAERAAAAGDRETEVIALLLMAAGCVFAGQPERAERAFDRAERACHDAGDRLHLGALYANRILLATHRKDPDAAIADGRRAIAIAREVGQSILEHSTLHNLAELLFWTGRSDEALDHAERARDLNKRLRFVPRPGSALLAARIRAAQGELDAAAELARWVREHCDPREVIGSHQVFLELVELRCRGGAGSSPAWRALVDRAREALTTDERLELLHVCVGECVRRGWSDLAGEVVLEARALAIDSPTWVTRFEELG